MSKALSSLLTALLIASFAGSAAAAGPRGYLPRACGFDLDDDGVIGEPAEDCWICDAPMNGGVLGVGTLDPDGDGVDEDLIYVDCDTGSDQSGCGLEGQPPCRSLQYAFDWIADGAGDGAEDIVCFRGTCPATGIAPVSIEYGVSIGGVPGTRTKLASGSEVRDWELPSNPAMIVGWDADGDGAYPPFDPDDKALLFGGAPNNFGLALFLGGPGRDNDYFELAHFSAADYGNLQSTHQNSGFLHPNDTSYLYLHDLDIDSINKDRCTPGALPCNGDSGQITFDMFRASGMQYFAILNSRFTDIGGFWMRGAAGNGPSTAAGPVRVQRITWTAHGEDGERGPNLAKLWGYFTGVEFLDSVFDANGTTSWVNVNTVNGVVMAQCSRDFDVINNEFIDLRQAVQMQGDAAGFCDNSNARTVDDLVVSRNVITNDHDYTLAFREFIGISMNSGGGDPGETTENIQVTDNFIRCSVDCQSCFFYDMTYSGPSQPGAIVFRGNSCDLEPSRPGFASFHVGSGAPTRYEIIELRENSFNGLALDSELNVKTGYAPSGWTADDNCYGASGRFSWDGGGAISFSSWQTSSGGDGGSFVSDPCPVPEPSRWLAQLSALAALAWLVRRRQAG